MEIENVNSKANAGLTTGIIGTALSGLLALGGGAGLIGLHSNLSNSQTKYVTKDEFDLAQKLNAKDCEIALLKSEQNTEVKIADVYERIMTRVNQNERTQNAWNAQQMVNNATMSSAITTNANSITVLQNTLAGITKTVVPINAVCPEPMKLYNSWTAPTTPTANA